MKKRPLKRTKRVRRVSKSPRRIAELEADWLWKELCLERDEGRCRRCGALTGTVHHIFRKAIGQYPKLRHELLNGVSACQGCHYRFHHFDVESVREDYIKMLGVSQYQDLVRMAALSKTNTMKYDPEMAVITLKAMKNELHPLSKGRQNHKFG